MKENNNNEMERKRKKTKKTSMIYTETDFVEKLINPCV